jgi:hypothetical protein
MLSTKVVENISLYFNLDAQVLHRELHEICPSIGCGVLQIMEVALIRDEAELPEPYDREEHTIVSVALCDNTANDDPLDERFSLTFTTASGRSLRVRLPACEMRALGEALVELAQERRWRDEI